MKKYFLSFIIVLILFFTIVSCFKKKGDDNKTDNSSNNELKDDNDAKTINNVTQYVSSWAVWVYANESDLGKKSNEVKEKILLDFGKPVTVISTKKISDKNYFKIQLPDDSIYWASQDNFAEKFIIINKTDVITYDQPDTGYATQLKLQPGDFGVFVKEKNGFMNVDFYAFRPYKIDSEKKWVGNKWIKEGYTDNINAAKEAFYLYLAYNNIQKNNVDEAKKNLEKAVELSDLNGETDITPVIKSLLSQLNINN
jgi:hypothetical protein